MLKKSSTDRIKIVVKKYSDGDVAYTVGVKSVVVGEGATYKQAIADVKSALKFHLRVFVCYQTTYLNATLDFPPALPHSSHAAP